MVGQTIETACKEMIKTGPEDNPTWEPRYKLSEILDEDFRFPAEDSPELGDIMLAEGILFDEVG